MRRKEPPRRRFSSMSIIFMHRKKEVRIKFIYWKEVIMKNNEHKYLSYGISFGMLAGATLGLTIGIFGLAIGAGIGMLLGIVIGTTIDHSKNKKDNDDK
ncbi:glycine zipper family protein [Tannockella kyphosi]|uniref:glycine zipper family protein n=1 Tax=Tannockella kyphosi TaxID=2899121 RepID=UPI0020120B26|nr:glycine zipper family protein [Tannockella kyphosi]